MNVFYINLDERTDRRVQIENELSKINCIVERIPAIKHSKGVIGCSKSHIKALKLAKERMLPQVLIVEDDLEWIVSSEYIEKALESLKSVKYDVVLLGGVFEPNATAKRVNEYFVSKTIAQTTVAYICKQDYYDALLDNYEMGLRNLEATGDEQTYVNDQIWKHLQRKDNWLFAYPVLCKQRVGYSNISNTNANYDDIYNRILQVS
jgi:GR25 family glycosyltransferase involved in LPS biosynthesis